MLETASSESPQVDWPDKCCVEPLLQQAALDAFFPMEVQRRCLNGIRLCEMPLKDDFGGCLTG